MPARSPKKPRDPEFVALNKIVTLLTALDAGGQARVMNYLVDRFGEPLNSDGSPIGDKSTADDVRGILPRD